MLLMVQLPVGPATRIQVQKDAVAATARAIEPEPLGVTPVANQHCAPWWQTVWYFVRVVNARDNVPPPPRPPLPQVPPRDPHASHVWSRYGSVFPAPIFPVDAWQ